MIGQWFSLMEVVHKFSDMLIEIFPTNSLLLSNDRPHSFIVAVT